MSANPSIQLGLLENWRQFSLLLLVNAFVGAMVGLERTIVPLIASEDFGLTSVSVTLTFIISFGVVKAFANLLAGSNADRIGRKPLLVAGWLIGIPVPFVVILAPAWEWVVFANVLLGCCYRCFLCAKHADTRSAKHNNMHRCKSQCPLSGRYFAV